MILNYCIEGVDIGEDDMVEIGEEVRRRGRPRHSCERWEELRSEKEKSDRKANLARFVKVSRKFYE